MEEQGDYSARASLALIGRSFRAMELWPIVCEQVHIPQKVKQYQPHEKLLDCFINILAGGQGLIEIETLVRPDRVLQRAFGRNGCAEQSTISDTLDACDAQTNAQMRAALRTILLRRGQGCRHDYTRQRQVLDVDMTGWPGGCQGEGVEKAFFPDKVHRRGRQLGRVLATRYEEVVVDRLYPGKRQLESCLVGLIGEAEEILALRGEGKEIQNKRENTVLRVDGGGGTEADINWMLSRGYTLMVKLHNAKRSSKLARSVETWVSDEKVPERQIGWVTQPTPYVLPTRQLAIRHRKRGAKHSDEFGYSVLVFNSSDATLAELLDLHAPCDPLSTQAMFNALHFYDLRGGALETQFKGDKQGLGLAHRNKRRFYAQEMLVLLGQLAHNVVIWSRNRLAQADPHFVHFGIRRMVRDVFRIEGAIGFDSNGVIVHVALNPRHPCAAAVTRAFWSDYV
jgi:hypothetical protein